LSLTDLSPTKGKGAGYLKEKYHDRKQIPGRNKKQFLSSPPYVDIEAIQGRNRE